MKYYVNSVLIFFLFCAVYGFAVPHFISAKDTLQVMTGALLAVSTPVALFYWMKAVFKPKKTIVVEEKTS